MHRTYARIPAHFFRISLHTEMDNMTLALVPDEEHAHLIARLLTKNYGLRKGERIQISSTIVRPVTSTDIEIGIEGCITHDSNTGQPALVAPPSGPARDNPAASVHGRVLSSPVSASQQKLS